MNDRELLGLAAKAFFTDGPTHIDNEGFMDWVRDCRGEWNPLTDDGDALRVAVSLGLTIECDFNDSDTCTVTQTRGDILADESAGMVGEIIGSTDFAATRRAIVRAAAQIGQSM